jgi:uncharacterized protein with PIN domain
METSGPCSIAHVRLYAELNELVVPERRATSFPYPFHGSPSIKDVVEAIGVPHTEVDLILADGVPVDFSWRLHDGARISVFPVFEALDITPVARLRPAPLRVVRFVVDGHLGRLARHLRMLGFDTLWWQSAADEELAHISAGERRVLLTRDRGLLKRSIVTHGCLVRSHDPFQQLVEVVRRLDLVRSFAPFSRFLRCNAPLDPISKDAIAERLPPRVRERHDRYRRCPDCGRLYWAGSHHDAMQRLVDRVKETWPSLATQRDWGANGR